ncbi:protoheme IX farnesyltransferase [Candidatus Saccharibacteria bacterium]|nr:MAG: protoheme IX farnesyltransferase [Candidatus Saccharibacteria bacterium]
MRLKDFILVAKPGIVVGNTLAVLGGFLYGSVDGVHFTALVGAVFGALLIIAASCVLNNYLDRDIDRRMHRTAKRASVTGIIPYRIALYYAAAMYLLGFGLMLWLTNIPTAAIGLTGAVLYTSVYYHAKRRTYWGTFVGAFPGATPPLAGYVAATGRLDRAALLLFIIMFVWQMPHFYAVGIFRMEDYKRANLPILPLAKGLSRTVWEMRFYGLLFIVACFLLARWEKAGFMFGLAMITMGLYWLQPMFSPNWRRATEATAQLVFKRSLQVLIALCFFLAMSHVLL